MIFKFFIHEGRVLKQEIEGGKYPPTQIEFNLKFYTNCPEYRFHFPQFYLGYGISCLLVEIR